MALEASTTSNTYVNTAVRLKYLAAAWVTWQPLQVLEGRMAWSVYKTMNDGWDDAFEVTHLLQLQNMPTQQDPQ